MQPVANSQALKTVAGASTQACLTICAGKLHLQKPIQSEVKNFKLCDQLTDEITELQRKRHALQMELQCLEKKEKKSKWYQKQKAPRKRALSPLSSDSESSVTPLSPQSCFLCLTQVFSWGSLQVQCREAIN